MKNFKKVVAGFSAIALVAMNLASVNAAAITDWVATVTATTGIVITSVGGGFGVNGTDTCSATITRTNQDSTTTAITVDSCTVTDTNTLTIAAGTVAANEYYTIAFTTSANAYGTTAAWDTTNSVAITARVLPILSMALSTSSLDFGSLALGANTVNLNITTASNAKDGITVSMASTGLATWDWDTEYHIWNLARNDWSTDSVATTGTDAYEVTSTNVTGWTVLTDATIAGTQNVLVTDNVTNSNSTTNVVLKATIDAQTESGNYGDTLTFTVTGNF